MPLLEQAVTLLLDYGLQVWTFWQDMEQVRPNYPSRHEALINNTKFQIEQSRPAGHVVKRANANRVRYCERGTKQFMSLELYSRAPRAAGSAERRSSVP